MFGPALRDLGRRRGYALGVIASTLAYAGVRVIPPLLARGLLDETLRGKPVVVFGAPVGPQAAVAVVPALILLVAGLLAGAQYMMRRWAAGLGQVFVGDLQVRLLEHLLRLPPASLERQALGRQMVRFSGDMSSVRRFVSRAVPEILRDTAAVVAIGIVLLTLHAALALVVLAIVAVYLAAVVFIWRRLRPVSRELRTQRGRIAGMVLDRLAVTWIVKLTRRERKEAAKLARRQDAVLATTRRSATLLGLLSGSAEAAVGLAVAASLGIGAREVMGGAITRGEMVAFYGLVLLLISPLRTLSRTAESLAQGSIAFERAYGLLGKTPERDPVGARPLRVTRGEIRLAGVRAHRWGQTLDFPDLHLAPGVTVVLGGPASGKTTLGHLLVGLARPAEGTLEIDGVDLSRATLASVRRAVAYIPAAPGLLKGSVRANLRTGLGNVSAEAMLQTLHAAGATWATGQTLRQTVGSGGRRFSPTQRWQILCARALLARPAVLVLDGLPTEGPPLDSLLRTLQDGGVRTILLLCDRPPATTAAGRTLSLDGLAVPVHA